MSEPKKRDPEIQLAMDIVGENPPVNRQMHADNLQEKHIRPLECWGKDADPLVEALRSEAVQEAFTAYDEFDKKALAAQSEYKARKKLIAWPMFAAVALLAVAFFIPPELVAEKFSPLFCGDESNCQLIIEHQWKQYIPFLILIGLTIPPLVSLFTDTNSHHEKWKMWRARAESMRREIFKRIKDAILAKDSVHDKLQAEPMRLLLLLEYFRRWQVELQTGYFIGRGKEHADDVNSSKTITTFYIVFLVLFVVFLALSSLAAVDEQGEMGLFNTIAQPFSFATNLEQLEIDRMLVVVLGLVAFIVLYWYYQNTINQALRNSARYEVVVKNFEALKGDVLEDTRIRAANGEVSAVIDYIDRVQGIMSIENNEWVRLQDLDKGRDNSAQAQPLEGDGTATDQPVD